MPKSMLRFAVVFFFSVLFFGLIPTPLFAQTCQTPGKPTNVRIEFPKCTGTTCDPARAGCSWDAVSGAANYKVSVTEVESGTVVLNNTTVTATSTDFAVTNGKTYKCDVSGVNSCGTSGTAASTTLLCKTDAPTAVPTQAPIPTIPPTSAPLPTMAPTGSSSVITLVIGGFFLSLLGGSLFFLFI